MAVRADVGAGQWPHPSPSVEVRIAGEEIVVEEWARRHTHRLQRMEGIEDVLVGRPRPQDVVEFVVMG